MRILFVSWHFYLDQSNGASISTRELLRALAARGWEASTFCGPTVDNPNVSSDEKVLAARKIAPLATTTRTAYGAPIVVPRFSRFWTRSNAGDQRIRPCPRRTRDRAADERRFPKARFRLRLQRSKRRAIMNAVVCQSTKFDVRDIGKTRVDGLKERFQSTTDQQK